jgi:hypothetical protein
MTTDLRELQQKHRDSRELLKILEQKAKKPGIPLEGRRKMLAMVRKQKAIVKMRFRALATATD